MVVSKVRGRFARFTGTVQIDDADLARSTVLATIETASIDTGVGQRDGHLRSPDFLDVEKFPELRFKSTRIEKSSEERYRVTGDLTIRDVTRELVLDVEYGGKASDPWGNQRAGFPPGPRSTARTGLKWNQVLEAGGLLVGERVDIELRSRRSNRQPSRRHSDLPVEVMPLVPVAAAGVRPPAAAARVPLP
jgi:polyisoprenoid-binding protein YceI